MKFIALSITIACCCVMTAGQSRARRKTAAAAEPAKYVCLNRIDRAQWTMLLDDVKKTDPDGWKKLNEDVELRKQQAKNLHELLAMSCQAVKDGLTADPIIVGELENVRRETTAIEYDGVVNKNKKANFELIGADRVTAFYTKPANTARFDEFLKVKTELLKRSGSLPDRELSAEEIDGAKDVFAKMAIYDDEAKLKWRTLGPAYAARANLKYKLQQAQFLARTVADKAHANIDVTDAEVDAYISSHPELGVEGKRTKAAAVLELAKSGKDFAQLANENTEDPGNAGANGSKNGGLYANVGLGMMVVPFEKAAISLVPGTIYPTLVETDFGYHIIKLEKKEDSKKADGSPDIKYDVRHILISTMQADPKDPTARPKTVKAFVKAKLETEREDRFSQEVLAGNPVEIVGFDPPLPVTKAPAARSRK